MSRMGDMLHAVIAVFRWPLSHPVETHAEIIEEHVDRAATVAQDRFLKSTSSLRATADRVCRRVAGLNGFDDDPPAAP